MTGKVSITKEQIAKLEQVSFPGEIHVIDSLSKSKSAIAYLNKCNKLGFDTETRPAFHRGVTHNVALMQISSDSDCFLFRLNKIGIPEDIKVLLENDKILKVGLSLKDDFGMLTKVSDASPHGFIDLQKFVPQYGITDASLQKIYAIIFGQRISKNQRLTNWEAETLTPSQQSYAAIDAWACLKIYDYLVNNGFEPFESKYYIPETDPEPQG